MCRSLKERPQPTRHARAKPCLPPFGSAPVRSPTDALAAFPSRHASGGCFQTTARTVLHGARLPGPPGGRGAGDTSIGAPLQPDDRIKRHSGQPTPRRACGEHRRAGVARSAERTRELSLQPGQPRSAVTVYGGDARPTSPTPGRSRKPAARSRHREASEPRRYGRAGGRQLVSHRCPPRCRDRTASGLSAPHHAASEAVRGRGGVERVPQLGLRGRGRRSPPVRAPRRARRPAAIRARGPAPLARRSPRGLAPGRPPRDAALSHG